MKVIREALEQSYEDYLSDEPDQHGIPDGLDEEGYTLFVEGYRRYLRGQKIPVDTSQKDALARGWFTAQDSREKFGPWGSAFAAPDEWDALRDVAISGWVRYFDARLNPDLGEQDLWGPDERPKWYTFFNLPDWLSEAVEIALRATERESFDE